MSESLSKHVLEGEYQNKAKGKEKKVLILTSSFFMTTSTFEQVRYA